MDRAFPTMIREDNSPKQKLQKRFQLLKSIRKRCLLPVKGKRRFRLDFGRCLQDWVRSPFLGSSGNCRSPKAVLFTMKIEVLVTISNCFAEDIILIYKPIDSTTKWTCSNYSPGQKLLGRLYKLTAVRFMFKKSKTVFPFAK